MKILLVLLIVFFGVVQASGDFGEGGGPKIIKSLSKNYELNIYKDRVEYVSFLDSLVLKTVDNKYELLDYEKVMRRNLLRAQFIKDSKKMEEYVKEGESFLIDKRKVSKKEFGSLEIKSIAIFYTENGNKYFSDDICDYMITVFKKQEVSKLSNLLELRLCGRFQQIIKADDIVKVKVEFHKN